MKRSEDKHKYRNISSLSNIHLKEGKKNVREMVLAIGMYTEMCSVGLYRSGGRVSGGQVTDQEQRKGHEDFAVKVGSRLRCICNIPFVLPLH